MMCSKSAILNWLFLFFFCSCQYLFASLPITDGLVMHMDAGTITGVSDGGPISMWSDLSGLGNDAIQATGLNQAVYDASNASFGGEASVHFDGANDYFNLPSGASCPINVGSFTVFIVAKFDDTVSWQDLCSGQGGSGDDRFRIQIDGQWNWRAGSSGWRAIQGGIPDTDVHVFGMTSDVEGFLDGVSVGTATNTSTLQPSHFIMGAENNGTGGYLNGDIAEFVLYDHVLTPEEYTQVNEYLMTKYFVPVPTVWSNLADTVDVGEKATLFFRVLTSDLTANQIFGLTELAGPDNLSWYSFKASCIIKGGSFQVRDGDDELPLFTISPNQWYNVWYVIDRTGEDYFDVYVNQGVGDAAYADLQRAGNDFRLTNADPLRSFCAAAANQTDSSVSVDNITVTVGEVLTNPVDFSGLPAAPVNLSAIAGDGQISLDWDDNTDADLGGYNVYRHTSSGGPYTQIATDVAKSHYVDNTATNGTTYYYIVMAVDLFSNESAGSSNEASATAVAQPVAPINLTRYMSVSADSTYSSVYPPQYAVDGIVNAQSRWLSADTTSPHWLEVSLAAAFEIGSANIFFGAEDNYPVANFMLQYWTGSTWVAIPGATVTGNTFTQVQIIFSSPVTTSKIRFYSDDDGIVRVKELAVFPPNGGAGFAIDTLVDLEVAACPMVTADSQNDSGTRPFLATDGFADINSRWCCLTGSADHWLQLEFVLDRTIAYAHVYTGNGDAGTSASDFHLESWDGAAWQTIGGTTVSGNISPTVALTFTAPVTTSMIRFVTTDDFVRVRELVLLPPNGGVGYPLGTAVTIAAPPTQQWDDYADNYYTIQNKVARLNLASAVNGAVTVQTANTGFAQQYQILLNIGTDTYRICNRTNARSLEVAGGSLLAGAVVREADYKALPYQQWRINAVSGSYVELVNVYTGLVLTVDGSGVDAGDGLIQLPSFSSDAQQWELVYVDHFPKKGVGKTNMTGAFTDKYAVSHYYNWRLTPSTGVGSAPHEPMKWGDVRSDGVDPWDKYLLFRPQWAIADASKYLMGFNEPDHGAQSNIPVDRALDLWSRMEGTSLPLVGPATSYMYNSWTTTFYGQAQSRGLRYEATGIHIYQTGGPNVGGFMTDCWNAWNNYGQRPVWISEWNLVNWGGAAWWTDDQEYTWMAELLWRMEEADYVGRYQFFPFWYYWSNGSPGAFEKDGAILPLGRLYGAWDGDTTVHENTEYFLNNRGNHLRVKNNTTVPDVDTINVYDNSMKWCLIPAQTSATYYLVSLSDGKRLSYNGSQLSLAAKGTIGTNVEWTYVSAGRGWYYLDHPATDTRLDSGISTGNLVMYANTNTWDSMKWFFVKPYTKNTTVINAPSNLIAATGGGQVTLDWDDNTDALLSGYNVYRSVFNNSRYTLYASGITSSQYTDTDAPPGKQFYYKVTAVDYLNRESAFSVEATAGYYAGDLTNDGIVNMADIAELGLGWQTMYNMRNLLNIANDWLLDASVQGHWPLDSNADDISDKSRHGIVYGSPVWASGHVGGSLAFDGVNDYVKIDGYKGIAGQGARTLSAWIKSTGTGANMVVASWGAAVAGQQYLFGIFADGGVVVYSAGPYIKTTQGVLDNQWHHVAAVLPNDGSPSLGEVQLYIDGVYQTDIYLSSERTLNTVAAGDMLIGALSTGSSQAAYFQGLIDDVRIYSKVVTETEIREIANN